MVIEVENTLLNDAENYAKSFIIKHVSPEYTYHNVDHTINVVKSAKEIAANFDISKEETEILLLAAWFHDTGYDKGSVNHEERSVNHAKAYLSKADYPLDKIEKVSACIMATKMPQSPQSLLERMLCDADLSHLGQNNYWSTCSSLRQEMSTTRNIEMTDQEWIDFEIDFIKKQHYYTFVARKLYDKKKDKHIRQLLKQKRRFSPNEEKSDLEALYDKKRSKKKKKKNNPPDNGDLQLKELDLGRGVETMYRTTYRTHVNLSSIADNKANIMLSINAIIISITVSTLVPSFDNNPKLVLPTVILLIVCLCSIVYATLSTRPKITEGKFSREDIKQKKSNLLFFGNFYNMNINDFHWGMMEMIKDKDFLYSSMTRDLYYLGIVLAKKYRYLNVCYGIFMYGLIISVFAFALSFIDFPKLFN